MKKATLVSSAGDDKFEKFKFLIEEGQKRIRDACDWYVKCIDNDPKAKEGFKNRFPDINNTGWQKFEQVGRRQLDHRLLMSINPNHYYLRQLPYSDQKRLLDDPFIELIPNYQSSARDKIRVPLEEMTGRQIDQVFGKGSLRTITEQKSYLKRKSLIKPVARPRVTAKDAKPYEIIKRNGRPVKIVIRRECEIMYDEFMKEVYS